MTGTAPGANDTLLVRNRFAVDTRAEDGREPVVAVAYVYADPVRAVRLGDGRPLTDADPLADPEDTTVGVYYVRDLDGNVTGWRDRYADGDELIHIVNEFRNEWGVGPTAYTFAAGRLRYIPYRPGVDEFTYNAPADR